MLWVLFRGSGAGGVVPWFRCRGCCSGVPVPRALCRGSARPGFKQVVQEKFACPRENPWSAPCGWMFFLHNRGSGRISRRNRGALHRGAVAEPRRAARGCGCSRNTVCGTGVPVVEPSWFQSGVRSPGFQAGCAGKIRLPARKPLVSSLRADVFPAQPGEGPDGTAEPGAENRGAEPPRAARNHGAWNHRGAEPPRREPRGTEQGTTPHGTGTRAHVGRAGRRSPRLGTKNRCVGGPLAHPHSGDDDYLTSDWQAEITSPSASCVAGSFTFFSSSVNSSSVYSDCSASSEHSQ